MSQIEKLREKMENNPRGDWRIEDIEKLARFYGFKYESGKGSHQNFSHEKLREIITIPIARPIKPYAIRQFLAAIAEVE